LNRITKLSLPLSLLIISSLAVLPYFAIDLLAQTPKPNVTERVTLPLNVSNAIYSANKTMDLGSKNISSTPYPVTEERAFDQGFLKGVGVITNNQTYKSTHLSDNLIQSTGKGKFETQDGQSIAWITSSIGRLVNDHWVFNGVILFNNTHSKSLSFLNNSIGFHKDIVGNEPDHIWLLK